MNKKSLIIALIALFVVLTPSLSMIDTVNGEADGPRVLIDLGNGETYWTDANTEFVNAVDMLEDALKRIGIDYEVSGASFNIDGRDKSTIGSVSCSWNYYVWDGSSWVKEILSTSTSYDGSSVAFGFYPSSSRPTETPTYESSWIMSRGNAEQTGHQTTDRSSDSKAESVFEMDLGDNNYVCSTSLIAGNKLFFCAGGGYSSSSPEPTLYCYDRITFEELWSFTYPTGAGYETATGVIVGDYIFLPATNGSLYKIPIEGPGENNKDVRTFNVPNALDHDILVPSYTTGPTSITYDRGVIFFGSSNGYIYCLDPNVGTSNHSDPKLIWKTEIDGCMYFVNPTIHDDILYAGAYDGCLYLLDVKTGKILVKEEVYVVEDRKGKRTGSVAVPVIVDGKIFVSFSDGKGMSALSGGIAIYEYDQGKLVKISLDESLGLASNHLLPVESEDFTGVYFTSLKVPLGKMYTDGTYEIINSDIETVKAGMILLNGESLIINEYRAAGSIYQVSLDGDILGKYSRPGNITYFSMSSAIPIDDHLYVGVDGGYYIVEGSFEADPKPSPGNIPSWAWILVVILVLVIAFAAYLAYIKKSKDVPPIAYIKGKFSASGGSNGENVSKTKKNKKRLLFVLAIGSIAAFAVFLCCLSFGPSGTIPLGEALSALVSSISKHGEDLTYTEIIIYESRLPRAIAAIGVGMGLSIAGALYQAVIRNPLVDPYIMGVSSGAGTFAVAALVANFTFFGLLEGSNYATPILAIAGGLLAFFATMLIAEKAGGSSTNFVLAGVIVGLAFSSLMTIMLVTSQSDKLHGALSWLYGSFANVGWDVVWLVFIPAVILSLIPLLWAKELNLVLLGEDQAQQMGLNVRRFNRWTLILASILTSVCVAFVGIIGFVGLVVPHVCRMILGGDHRLVLPASIVLGAALMLFADLLSRMIMVPMELPVGAITTMIGVPLFVYLLIRRGRMYDG